MELTSRKEEKYYLNVVNIDKYDTILGAPFMRKFSIQLDFNSNSIVVRNTTIQVLLPEEEATLLKGRGIHRRGEEDAFTK